MLKEVGEAGAVTRFDAETNLVVHSHGYDGSGAVLRENDLQAIGQLVVGDRNLVCDCSPPANAVIATRTARAANLAFQSIIFVPLGILFLNRV